MGSSVARVVDGAGVARDIGLVLKRLRKRFTLRVRGGLVVLGAGVTLLEEDWGLILRLRKFEEFLDRLRRVVGGWVEGVSEGEVLDRGGGEGGGGRL